MSAEANLEKRLHELGLDLPQPATPKGAYTPLLELDGAIYLSGHLPIRADGSLVAGRLGEDLDEAAGHEAARLCCLALLATARAHLDSLDKITQVMKIFAAVNSTPDFTAQPAVVNGCSELLIDIFGSEAGMGVRSAIGAAVLPLGAAVEIEAVFLVDND
jgi:enamine deaminase RidA (YjgF/YER057c/UK114 family)